MPLRTQETKVPTNKVTAGGLGGAVATLIVFVATQLGVEVTPEAGGALATLVGFVFAYFVRDREDE